MNEPVPAPPVVDPPASIGRRAFARLFDIAVVAVVAVPVLTLTLRDGDGDDVRFPLVVIVLYAVLPAVFEARLLARSGATPGKRLSGLRVVRRAGDEVLSPPAAVVRALLTWTVPALVVLLLDAPIVAAVLLALFGPALIPGLHRDLPDLLAGTRVVFTGDLVDDVAGDPPPAT